MMHRQEQHVGPDLHALRACRYGRRNYERTRQVAVVHEVVLREPDARVPQPFGLLDLLEALRIEPRVVAERRPLPEVIPESKGRNVCSQVASSADAPHQFTPGAGLSIFGGARLPPCAEDLGLEPWLVPGFSPAPSVVERLAGVDEVRVGYAVGRCQVLYRGPQLGGDAGERVPP